MASTQTLDKKKKQVDEIAEIFNSNGVYLFDYRGLSVAQMNNLRTRVKDLNADMKVIKNRLAIKYFERENLGIGRDIFSGPTAVAYANDKFVEVAKALVDYEKENDKVKIKAGFIEKKFADKEKVKFVAKLPAKEVLMAQLLGVIAMPLKKMGIALSAPLLNMLILMNNLKDKKEKENEEKNNG